MRHINKFSIFESMGNTFDDLVQKVNDIFIELVDDRKIYIQPSPGFENVYIIVKGDDSTAPNDNFESYYNYQKDKFQTIEDIRTGIERLKDSFPNIEITSGVYNVSPKNSLAIKISLEKKDSFYEKSNKGQFISLDITKLSKLLDISQVNFGIWEGGKSQILKISFKKKDDLENNINFIEKLKELTIEGEKFISEVEIKKDYEETTYGSMGKRTQIVNYVSAYLNKKFHYHLSRIR
jgi:hypothetical protein